VRVLRSAAEVAGLMSRATEVERLMSRATDEAGLMSRPTEVARLMSRPTDEAGLMSRPTDEARLMIRRATGTRERVLARRALLPAPPSPPPLCLACGVADSVPSLDVARPVRCVNATEPLCAAL